MVQNEIYFEIYIILYIYLYIFTHTHVFLLTIVFVLLIKIYKFCGKSINMSCNLFDLIMLTVHYRHNEVITYLVI